MSLIDIGNRRLSATFLGQGGPLDFPFPVAVISLPNSARGELLDTP